MRILKFAGAFLATLLIVFLIVFGFNLEALFTLFENQEGIQEGQEWALKTTSLKGLTEYIGAQPRHVSIASVAINNPNSSIRYNTRTPRTMGRLSNLFSVIEYARQVEDGSLDPDKPVPFRQINQYQLPYMDESDHEDALGWLREQSAVIDSTVALKHVVEAAISYNDIAIADFLLYKVGFENIEQLLSDLSIEETEEPMPFSGLYITLNPNLQDRTTEAHFDSLSRLSRDVFHDMVLDKTERFINQPDYRKRVLEQFEDGEGLGIKFTRQRDALVFFPKTTAGEMSRLMKQIQQEKLLSESISKKLKTLLDWPLRNENRLTKDFKTYGAIYDNRMGMASGIDYGASSYTGEPFAQAVFFDELQIAFWFQISSNLMHEDFQQRLIWDPALRKATVDQINQSESDTTAS